MTTYRKKGTSKKKEEDIGKSFLNNSIHAQIFLLQHLFLVAFTTLYLVGKEKELTKPTLLFVFPLQINSWLQK